MNQVTIPDVNIHNTNETAPRFIRSVLNMIDVLCRLDGWLGAMCLVTLTTLMTSGIVVRAFANVIPWLPRDIPIAWEYSSYLMAVTFTFGSAMTLRAGGHIRVRIFFSSASRFRIRAIELFASTAAASFGLFFSYAMTHFAFRSFAIDERSIASNTPLWIPKTMVAFGVILFTLQLITRMIQVILNLPIEDKSIVR